MWGIIGLGNPGVRYAGTRHNVGFEVVDLLTLQWWGTRPAAGAPIAADRSGLRSLAGAQPFSAVRGRFENHDVVLVKPSTYVNRSGIAVEALLHAYDDIQLSSLLVILDDVALPFGRLRLRASGSAGGHNGLRSIEAALESRQYARLRFGVGAQNPGEDLAEHVLGPFDAHEAKELPDFLESAATAVECIVRHGVEAAIPQVNARDSSDRLAPSDQDAGGDDRRQDPVDEDDSDQDGTSA